MNPDWLLKHFEQISEAPDAIPRLRRFILDLAVRGKLVEQDPEDEPAAEVLKRIQANGDHGSNDGERKNQNSLPAIERGEIALEIPENWVLARVGELLDIQYGKALPAADRSVQGSVAVYGSNGVVGYCEATLAQEPAIIIGRKGSAGALNLCDGPSWTTDVAYFLIPPAFFNIRFLFVALQTLDLARLGKGVKPGLNRSEAYQLPIVVPPLAEQHRIVARVDELMALCNELEAAQVKRQRRRDRLVAATLHGLNNSDTSPEPGTRPTFEESVRFYFNHLPRLTTRPEHIHQLRQTILNLAVRGKLVPQDPNDEPAVELMRDIENEKHRLIAEGTIKRVIPLPKVAENERPFNLPPNWLWERFGNVAAIQSNLVKPQDYPEHPHIAPDNIESRTGKLLPYVTVDESKVTSAKHLFFPNSIIYSKIRPNLAKATIVNFEGLCSADAYPIYPLLNIQYLLKFMISEVFVSQSVEEDNRVAMPKINQEALNKILVAVPPPTRARPNRGEGGRTDDAVRRTGSTDYHHRLHPPTTP